MVADSGYPRGARGEGAGAGVADVAPRPEKLERRAGEAAVVEEGDRVLTEGGFVG